MDIGEVGRNPNDAIDDHCLQVLLRDLLQVTEEHGEDLDGGERALFVQEIDAEQDPSIRGLGGIEWEAAKVILNNGIAERAANEALDLGDGVSREAGGGSSAGSPDETLFIAEADHGRSLALGLVVEEDVDAALPNGADDAAVIADVKADYAHLGACTQSRKAEEQFEVGIWIRNEKNPREREKREGEEERD